MFASLRVCVRARARSLARSKAYYAHESAVWDLDWTPLGHILCSASNDHTIKFWTRNRPGDVMDDKYQVCVCARVCV